MAENQEKSKKPARMNRIVYDRAHEFCSRYSPDGEPEEYRRADQRKHPERPRRFLVYGEDADESRCLADHASDEPLRRARQAVPLEKAAHPLRGQLRIGLQPLAPTIQP